MQPPPLGTILIIDDEVAHQRILTQILVGAGYRVHASASGLAAPALARELAPDLIVLDVALPDADGYSVCRSLKADPALASIPVIFLSAAHETRSKTAAFAAGAVDYVGKPFDAPEVLARARAHIELYRLQSQLEQQVAARTAALQAQVAANEALLDALRRERASLAAGVAARTQELQLVNERLAQAMQAKDAFLAGMSHELRTPLNAILGLAEMLGEGLYGDLDERQQRAIGTIGSSGQHLLSLINDILDLAKIEAGREELELDPLATTEICEAAVALVAEGARAKGLAIEAQLPDTLPVLHADGRRLRQILVNLLANAVRFTPEGGRVGVEAAAEEGGATMRFTVWDTGVGIDAGQQERLFRAFTQVDGGLTRVPGGTGLGLALVARLARLHGGSVALTSAAGAGSRFSVALPCAPAGPGADPDPAAPLVVVVDDQEQSAGAIAAAVRAAGFRCAVTGAGAALAALARELEPRAIVAALPMADHQGVAFLPQLRALGAGAPPILAIGSVVLDASAARALAAGAAAYLSLPLAPGTLAAALRAIAP